MVVDFESYCLETEVIALLSGPSKLVLLAVESVY